MPPKKKEVQKLSYGEFMTNNSFGGNTGSSWADEVEESYESGTQPLPATDRRPLGSGSYGGDRLGGYSQRDIGPQRIPDRPPYLAHLGNLDYDVKEEDLGQLLEDCEVTSIRLIEDRELKRPKGFGYAEFATVEGLKKALALDGVSFQGRSIKIRIADPPKDRDRGGGDSTRDFGDWTRKGPLPDLPSRGNDRRSGPSDFADRRPPRETPIDEKPRDFGNWERKGPLSPLPQQERPAPAREGSRPRTNEGQPDSMRSNRRLSPAAWGEGRQEGSRPPRRDAPDRPERVPSAADRDMQWRSSMRPDAPGKSPTQSRSGSEAPPSPAPAVVVPAMRPKLNLTKRTVSDAPDVTSPALTSAGESKASPFGAARPIDTAAREREIEEKRLAAIKEKKDADDKAKEERRAAKEAVVEEAAVSQQTEALANAETETGDLEEDVDGGSAPPIKRAAEAKPDAAQDGNTDEAGDAVQSVKTRATESGNWRHPSGEQRGGRGSAPGGPRRGSGATRGGRAEAARPARANGGSSVPVPQTQTLPVSSEEAEKRGPDEEGWERVPTNKGRRNQKGRPAS